MKFTLFLLSILFTTTSSSNSFFEDDCEGANQILDSNNLSSVQSIQLPNCANNKIQSLSVSKDITEACQECIPEFNRRRAAHGLPYKSLNVRSVIADEFRKNISFALADISSLQSLGEFNIEYDELSKSCDLNEGLKGCSSDLANEFKKRLSNELAYLISKNPSSKTDGLLDRSTNQGMCSISDRDIMSARSKATERELSNPEIVQILSNLDTTNGDLATSLANSLKGKNDELKALILDHPLLSRLARKSPREFVNFFKSLPQNVNETSFKESLLNSQAIKSSFTDSIKASCTRNIENLQKYFCSTPGISNQVQINDLDSVQSALDREILLNNNEFTSTNPIEYGMTLELARLCEVKTSSKKAPNLSVILNEMNSEIPKTFASKNLADCSREVYMSRINASRSQMCSYKNGTTCNESDIQCRIYKTYEDQQREGTPSYRLANSSDPRVNALLRNMIGNPVASTLSTETRTTLVEAGIIPETPGGEVRSQPQVDRNPSSPTFGQTTSSSRVAAARVDRADPPRGSATRSYTSNQLTSSDLNIDPTTLSDDENRQLVQGMGDSMANSMLRNAIDNDLAASSARGPTTTSRGPTARSAQVRNAQQANALGSAQQNFAQNDQSNYQGAPAPEFQGNGARAQLDNVEDPRKVQARENLNRALADMDAKNQRGSSAGGSSGAGGAGSLASREPASTSNIERASDGSIAITVNPSQVYQELVEQLRQQTPESREILNQIAALRSFSFKLNGSQVSAEFRNGTYVVNGINGPMKSEVERFLNELKSRANLTQLNQTLRR